MVRRPTLPPGARARGRRLLEQRDLDAALVPRFRVERGSMGVLGAPGWLHDHREDVNLSENVGPSVDLDWSRTV